MTSRELSFYFKKQCRFRLRNGREVFGVIWEDAQGNEKRYYFASANDHRLYEATRDQSDVPRLNMYPVDLSEILFAERLGA